MAVFLTVLSLAAFVTIALASPWFRRCVLSGAGWGVFFALWIVAPLVLESHRIHVADVRTASILLTVFTALGIGFGIALTTVVFLPLAAYALWRRRTWSVETATVVSGAALPVAYIAVSLLIEHVQFGRPVSAGRTAGQAQIGAALVICIGLLVLGASNISIALRKLMIDRRLVALALLSGAAVLPFRDGPRPPEAVAGEPLVRRSRGLQPPLVIVGLDGVGWNVVEPLLQRGGLPWLRSVLANGRRGTVAARWPPHWSGPAWAAITTGFEREDTGVFGDLYASAPDLPNFELPLQLDLRLNPLFVLELELLRRGVMSALPMPRFHLRRSPLWERVAAAGDHVGVIRFPFTYPAIDQSATIVSSLVSLDLWDFAALAPSPESLVAPVEKSTEMLALFRRPAAADDLTLRRIRPAPQWELSAGEVNRLWLLDRVFDISEKTFEAAERVQDITRPFDLFMLYVPSFDSVSHALWRYRFPSSFAEDAPPSADVDALGPVLDRYLQYLDSRIGQVLSRMPAANVIVVADHGQVASPWHEIWSGWHSAEGIFAAAGPDIAYSSQPLTVEYVDIVPLALELMGFERPSDLPGSRVSLTRARR